jgi:hypothetical protein
MSMKKALCRSGSKKQKINWMQQCKNALIKEIIPYWIKNGIDDSLDLRGTQVKSLGQLKEVGGSWRQISRK